MDFYNIKQKISEKGDGARVSFMVYEKELFFGVLLVLVALLSFGLGRLSKIEGSKVPIRIENGITTSSSEANISLSGESSASVETKAVVADNSAQDYQVGSVIVSSRGKKYHFPWCPGAKSIKESNKIVLTEAEAKAKGYTLASGCSAISGE